MKDEIVKLEIAMPHNFDRDGKPIKYVLQLGTREDWFRLDKKGKKKLIAERILKCPDINLTNIDKL